MNKEQLAISKGWSKEIWLAKDRLGDDIGTNAWYWYDPEGNAYSEEEFNNIEILIN